MNNEQQINNKFMKTAQTPNPKITSTGNKFWFNENGNLHRDEGDKPACEWNNGNKEWWINGNMYRYDSWLTKL